MANVFQENRDIRQNPKRNNFDLSFQSHSTFKFGYYYPVVCIPVVQGDSFNIRALFDLKMMPLAFPLQSRVTARLHFFYNPIKNVWPNFENYITGAPRLSPIVHPYIKVNQSSIKTGSIHDFLGVPTTVVTKTPVNANCPYLGTSPLQLSCQVWYSPASFGTSASFTSQLSKTQGNKPYIRFVFSLPPSYITDGIFDFSNFALKTYLKNYIDSLGSPKLKIIIDDIADHMNVLHDFTFNSDTFQLTLSETAVSTINDAVRGGHSIIISLDKLAISSYPSDLSLVGATAATYENACAVAGFANAAGVYEYSSLNASVYDGLIHLNALPYRCYEQIYRAYFASDVWQPLVINGQKEYNKFCTNDGDGADETDYHLFRRNYESDFLTTALPSPQSGNAPLVGMSALGDITIESDDGITNAKAVIGDNGTIVDVAVTSPIASVEHGRTLINIASVGMNINDFRNANALQKYLEQTLRSGYRYVDFIRGMFGHTPKDVSADMPTFIGGFSRDLVVNTVISQSDTAGIGDGGKNLGDFAGTGRVVGKGEHDINFYCSDYGYIMGILSITPTPAYSQLLPKHMICPKNHLDYYNPFFAQLGMQSIPYTEVAPLQSYVDSLNDPSKKLTDTFGYQRPNYDMTAHVDEVHGEFRSTLKDYLINRQFDGRPELGSEFLEVNPSEINDVFINQNPDDDVFIGNLLFQIFAKRPIPRIHMPHL